MALLHSRSFYVRDTSSLLSITLLSPEMIVLCAENKLGYVLG